MEGRKRGPIRGSGGGDNVIWSRECVVHDAFNQGGKEKHGTH